MYTCVRFTLRGRVQGVFFRATTRDKALELDIQGWVRNISTGQVEILACGEPENVDELQKWLWQGPKFAKVTDVASELVTGEFDVEGFEVRRDG